MAQTSQTALASVQSDFVIQPLNPVIGAEVIGLDVSQPLTSAAFRRLDDAFNQYHLLCIRDQNLNADTLVDFTQYWGPLTEHTMPGQLRDGVRSDVNVASNAGPDGKPTGRHPDPTAMRWHTDRSWRRMPAMATLLYGSETPSVGGDTLFCNTVKAYQALPDDLRARVDGLKAIHSVEYSRKTGGGAPATEHELRVAPPIAHPLARMHPITGQRALYIGCHTWKIEGLPEDEGRRMLDELMDFAAQDEFVYTHKWRRHDLLMWDNRCTLHSATPYDTTKELRIMLRTVVEGGPTS